MGSWGAAGTPTAANLFSQLKALSLAKPASIAALTASGLFLRAAVSLNFGSSANSGFPNALAKPRQCPSVRALIIKFPSPVLNKPEVGNNAGDEFPIRGCSNPIA